MPLVPQRRWVLPVVSVEATPDGVPPLVARIMAARGLASADMPAFLEARPTEAGPPMLDLEKAVERIRRALAARERIAVHGDYDMQHVSKADGTPVNTNSKKFQRDLNNDVCPEHNQFKHGANDDYKPDGKTPGRNPDPDEKYVVIDAVSIHKPYAAGPR